MLAEYKDTEIFEIIDEFVFFNAKLRRAYQVEDVTG